MLRTMSIVGMALLMSTICLAQAKEAPKPAQPEQPRRDFRGGGGFRDMDPETRQKYQELRDIEQKLDAAEKTAQETNPDLQALRKKIQTTLEDLATMVRDLDQKTDEAVMKASPELEQTVGEKRVLQADIQAKMGQNATAFWLMRMRRAMMDMLAGRPAAPAPPGAAKPAAPAPAAPPAK